MALKRVQWQQKTADGNDVIVPNAIANADETSSGFTQDENGVLKAGDEIVCKKRLIWSGSATGSSTDRQSTITVDIGQTVIFKLDYTKYEIYGYTRMSGTINHKFVTMQNVAIELPNNKLDTFGHVFASVYKTDSQGYNGLWWMRVVANSNGEIVFYPPTDATSFSTNTIVITRIYEIIE